MKQCTKCNETKPLTEFHTYKRTKDGKQYRCKSCAKVARKAYYKANKTTALIRNKAWSGVNKTSITASSEKYRQANKGAYTAYTTAYRARKLQATPSWADMNVVKLIYLEAQSKNLHVDHIIPLNSSIVCGLHCEDNLQLLTPFDNRVKSNKHTPQYPLSVEVVSSQSGSV